MARKRKLTAPSADDLNRLEQEFRRETSPRGPMAPIAQVAAEAAQSAPVENAEIRAEQARIEADAKALRAARERGLVMVELPLSQVVETEMIRDRTVLIESELEELKSSIALNGLRLPIEVQALPEGDDGAPRYGLISGYRRLLAFRGLHALVGGDKYATIKALIRPETGSADAFAAMVEENEIRASLSHFERGRIAVLAAQSGAFTNMQEAVEKLFATASKAKRSKVRSFAQVFEDLGDVLAFPEDLTEKQGLRLAGALRAGAETPLRQALADGSPASADEEWALVAPILEDVETEPKPASRGGRPRKGARPALPGVIELNGGITLRRTSDTNGYAIRVEGRGVDGEMIDAVMLELQRLLERR